MATADDFFKEFNSIDWRTQWTLSALRAFETYWRETEKLVAAAADAEERVNSPKWDLKNEEEYWEYRSIVRAVRHHHDEFVIPTFRYATVVTLFAIVERELRRAADYIANEDKVSINYAARNGSVIPAVSDYIKSRRKVSLGDLPGFSDMIDLQKVRDCIVHCYGDVGQSRDRARLKALSSPLRGLDSHPGTEMEIASVFLERAIASIRKFFLALFGKLNWSIKDEWVRKPTKSKPPQEMNDTYGSIGELRSKKIEGTDFEIKSTHVPGKPFVVVAPHAGGIEPRTGPIAQSIAREDFSLYQFIGKQSGGGNKCLHVTSHRFDEEKCVKLVADHETVVAVHGCKGEEEAIYLGGLDTPLIVALAEALTTDGFTVSTSGHSYPGEEATNICNRGRSGRGVQFELTHGLRHGPRVNQFSETVRRVLQQFGG